MKELEIYKANLVRKIKAETSEPDAKRHGLMFGGCPKQSDPPEQ